MAYYLFSSLALNIFTVFIILITYLYYFSIKTYNHWKIRHVKFIKPVPFFGNSLLTIFRKKSLPENQVDIYNHFPAEKFVGIYIFRIPVLMIRDPQLVHRVVSKDFTSFYDRGITTDERLDLLSLHLINLKGQQWKSLRNKLTPAFSSGKLKSMSSQLEECANTLSEHLENSLQTNSRPTQEILEIMAKYATDVIGSCAFGLHINSLKDPDCIFRKMGKDIFKPSLRVILKFITRAFHPNLPYYFNLKLLHYDVEKFFLEFVKDAVFQREQNQVEKKDFIQILIELRKHDHISFEGSKETNFLLSDQALASNVFAFFLGGFETISSTMSFFLLELAANPSIQDAVRNEILQALNEQNGELNYDTIKNLKYIEMVLSETLRKYPIGTVLLRECTQSYKVPDSTFVIEKGTRILIPVFALHYDPSYFTDPERFDPERFSPENKAKIVQGTYLPFGDGPRVCIGLRFAMMEMKHAFCKIIPKYEFSMSDRTVYPVQFKKGVPLLAAQDGIWLNVKARNG